MKAFDKEDKLVKETITPGETAYLNDDNSLTYLGEDFQIEDTPLLTKAPKSTQKEPVVTPTKPKSDNLTDIPTPEDKFANIRIDEEVYITKFESDFKHIFRVSSGINNWLISTGNQKYAQSNDNLARWYIFVNKYAHEKDTEGRHKYNLKSYSFRQVGLLEELDPIRQNLTFVTSEEGDLKTYDQIEDKGNSFANDDIKIVVFERTGKLVQVSKNGDPADTEDKTQVLFNSLPTAELKTTRGYERFSLNKERETFLKKPGATEEQFTTYINKELEKSRVEYSNLRETMKDTQVVFDINAINPGAKIKVNENKENVLVEQDLLDAAGLTKVTSLSKRIRFEARKSGSDAYNTKVNHTYSGTEHGITNGFWYLGIDNRLELIKPKTLGETESVDNIVQLLQFVAKGLDKDNTIKGYIHTILYSGVNNNTGARSPYAFYFDYPRDAKNKIIGEFTSLAIWRY